MEDPLKIQYPQNKIVEDVGQLLTGDNIYIFVRLMSKPDFYFPAMDLIFSKIPDVNVSERVTCTQEMSCAEYPIDCNPSQWFNVLKFVTSTTERWTLIPVILQREIGSSHAVALIVDRKKKAIQMFNPHWDNQDYWADDESIQNSVFVKFLASAGYTYIAKRDSVPEFGPQSNEGRKLYHRDLESWTQGWCTIYTMRYLYLRVTQPDITNAELNTLLLENNLKTMERFMFQVWQMLLRVGFFDVNLSLTPNPAGTRVRHNLLLPFQLIEYGLALFKGGVKVKKDEEFPFPKWLEWLGEVDVEVNENDERWGTKFWELKIKEFIPDCRPFLVSIDEP